MNVIDPGKSLVEQTYTALLDAICSGQLEPGTRLSQDSLAETLQVSRQPVNSAIAMLKAQKFVEDTGRRGVIVAPISSVFFRAMYEFRSGIDPLAVRLATPRMDEKSILAGRRIIAAGKQAIISGSASQAIQADMNFHNMIYDLSGNVLIRDVMTLNWRHQQRAMGQVLQNPGMTISVWKEHEDIFEKMVQGQSEEAAQAAENHVRNAAERFCPAG